MDKKINEQAYGDNIEEAYLEASKKMPVRVKELVMRVVVSPDINESDLKATVTHVINEETSADKDLDEITAFIYDRNEDTESAYTVARAIWAYNGKLGTISKDAAQNNDRTGYQITWDIKSRIKQPITFSTEEESNIYYKYQDVYKSVIDEFGLDPFPRPGEKYAPTPSKNKAMELTAKEFNITTSELAAILDRVSRSKPTDEELRIFTLYDGELNKELDRASQSGGLPNEDKITKEVALSLGITPQKLSDIWTRVYIWQNR